MMIKDCKLLIELHYIRIVQVLEKYVKQRFWIFIIGGSGLGKTNVLLNLINNQLDIDKIYLYAKDPYEAKYQYLINKGEK